MLIIDRFEGNMAVIEVQEQSFSIPKNSLPATAKEGDVIKIIVDKETTTQLKEDINKLADSLFK
ncbi:DUF3006 domain-containing protein [Orenia marismortui]|uniref:DUF3006 family protein n=1 Tax=Orenia marismortui TaxID=46469 RepID=A0A4V3GWW3_9FIRM|nr:DUF3006 domain-containing protein [Orenia marismortui]TDX45519.1 hypothetical protein C7959_1439 [Orenia marismortui]